MKKKLIIDCTFTSTTNLNTGIQRVIRNVIKNIFEISKNSEYKPIIVSLDSGKILEINLYNKKLTNKKEVLVKEGDILLLIDSTWHLDIWKSVEYAKLNKAMVIAIIYDLIPINYSQFCDDGLVKYFKKWLHLASLYCDGFISISNTVNKDLQKYLKKEYTPYNIKNKQFDFFSLGADLKLKKSSKINIRENLQKIYSTNTNIYLIVCTVEPRKNHKYLLDVFDILWEEGMNVSLNIVGKVGWKVDNLISRINKHPQFNKKLFHWDNLNDEELNYCYKNSKMLLFPSFVEGFGLPIIESLFHGLPVLASNTPIHKEIAGESIDYFDLNDNASLIKKIKDIEINGIDKYKKPLSTNYNWLNWEESTKMLFEKILLMNSKFKPNLDGFTPLEHKLNRYKLFKQKLKNIPFLGVFLKKIYYFFSKERLKRIPFLGYLLRWLYNLLRLNNIKFKVFNQQEQINDLNAKINLAQEKIQELISENKKLANDLTSQKDKLTQIDQEQSFKAYKYASDNFIKQSLFFNQKIDTFLKKLKNTPNLNIQNIKKESKTHLLDQYYLEFENTFRGSRQYIINRYTPYLNYLDKDITTALDIGCGRAEWVQLLQKEGINAFGIDQNQAMIHLAKSEGVKNVFSKDAFEYLASVDQNKFDLITSFHVIEHISYEILLDFLLEIKRVLKPKAKLLLETPNPLNLQVSTYEFYKDPTHLNPLPSDIIKFLLEFLGFKEIKVIYLHSLSNDEHLCKNMNEAQDYLILAKNGK